MQSLGHGRRRGHLLGRASLEEVSMAESGGLVRAFADTLPEVVDLVRRFAQDGTHAPVSRVFIDHALGAASVAVPEASKPAAATGGAILTPKENEVLQLLAGGLPNKRIASQLGLSSETAK
jgi:DNA-binding NarL/FixJ family response regulator